MKQPISLIVNGEQHDTLCTPNLTLLEVLRENLQLTGTKHGCELGECGACAVLLDGDIVVVLAHDATGCYASAVMSGTGDGV